MIVPSELTGVVFPIHFRSSSEFIFGVIAPFRVYAEKNSQIFRVAAPA
jgi:hypothetical protein